jgi:hypothetical protein
MGTRSETDTSSEILEVSRADQEAALHAEAMQCLGISGAEFRRRWYGGEYADSDDPRVTEVAMLLPDAW